MSNKNNEYEEIKKRYIELFEIKRFKKTNTAEMMLYRIKIKEAEIENKRRLDKYNDNVRKAYQENFGYDLDSYFYYYKFNYSFTKSTLLRYFKPKQIDLFPCDYVKNPHYSSASLMKVYELRDIIKVCYEQKLKPREDFKNLPEWDGYSKQEQQEREQKIKATDEVINAYKKTLQG